MKGLAMKFAKTHAAQLIAGGLAIAFVVLFGMGKIDEKTLILVLGALGFPTGLKLATDDEDGASPDAGEDGGSP